MQFIEEGAPRREFGCKPRGWSLSFLCLLWVALQSLEWSITPGLQTFSGLKGTVTQAELGVFLLRSQKCRTVRHYTKVALVFASCIVLGLAKCSSTIFLLAIVFKSSVHSWCCIQLTLSISRLQLKRYIEEATRTVVKLLAKLSKCLSNSVFGIKRDELKCDCFRKEDLLVNI